MNVGDKEAFLLLVGMFLSRSLITTVSTLLPLKHGVGGGGGECVCWGYGENF